MSLSRETIVSAILYHLSIYSEVRLPYLGILTADSDGAHLDTSTHLMRNPRRSLILKKEDYKKRIDLLSTINNHYNPDVVYSDLDEIFAGWKDEIDSDESIHLPPLGTLSKEINSIAFTSDEAILKFINPELDRVKWVPKIATPTQPQKRSINYERKTGKRWGLFRLVSLFVFALCITLVVLAFNSNTSKKQGDGISPQSGKVEAAYTAANTKKSTEVIGEVNPSSQIIVQQESEPAASTITESTILDELIEADSHRNNDDDSNVATKSESTSKVMKSTKETESEVSVMKQPKEGCYLITGAFTIPENAFKMNSSLSKDFENVHVFKKGRLNMVGIPVECDDFSQAKARLKEMKLESWTYRK